MLKLSNRLKSWKTNPRFSRRNADTSESRSVERFFPFSRTSPEVALSKAARIFKRVVFPEPDSPIIATYSPFSTEKLTSVRACTWLPPNLVVYTFFTLFTSKIAITILLVFCCSGNSIADFGGGCLNFGLHFAGNFLRFCKIGEE